MDWRGAIAAAADRIAAYVRVTPFIDGVGAAFPGGADVTLKLEQLQHSGTFKARGAFNSLLSRDVPTSGVIAASGGNHGAAVAYAASVLGYPAEIFVPTIASPAKVARLESYGATVHMTGNEFAETLEACNARQAETGAISIHAYDALETVVGQGTLGRELAAQTQLDTVLVAVGGGGLIGGVSAWYQGDARLVAVETHGTAALHKALQAGAPVETQVSGIAADALGARVIGELALANAEQFVDASVLIADEDVAAGQRHLWDQFRLIAEPAGAAAYAALLCGAYQPQRGERVGIIVCGANTELSKVPA